MTDLDRFLTSWQGSCTKCGYPVPIQYGAYVAKLCKACYREKVRRLQSYCRKEAGPVTKKRLDRRS